ncbi:hypothetical protein VIGAN_06073800 [Vigna angularis var. angularis]|uniref:Uncharacterized protein n=1 Tax=Vigna angularis var. angularis TaxID=157739 RepID=A0A0S3SA11_PHAAN|nr:hypothetical protein VIGAN_06073800 [Vigna angularis var. angularis]
MPSFVQKPRNKDVKTSGKEEKYSMAMKGRSDAGGASNQLCLRISATVVMVYGEAPAGMVMAPLLVFDVWRERSLWSEVQRCFQLPLQQHGDDGRNGIRWEGGPQFNATCGDASDCRRGSDAVPSQRCRRDEEVHEKACMEMGSLYWHLYWKFGGRR